MRLWPRRALFCALFFLAIPFSNDLIAQTTTSGELTGVVTDQSNAVLPNVDVEIRDNSKGTIHATKTDRIGVYRFSFLTPATYLLTVAMTGFRREGRVVNLTKVWRSGQIRAKLSASK